MRRLPMTVVLMLTAGLLYADVPNEIAYQGRLREYGQPVTGTRTMNFKIYRTASGPGLDWESGNVDVQVSSGVFSHILTPDIDWRIKDRWIETVVNGKTLVPREKITAQAYALHSRTTEDISKAAGATVDFTIGNERKAQINTSGELINLIGNTTYYMVPRGAIIMWSGAIASIPTGWALCDGTNGTPDLRDKFIVGAGLSYNPNSTGGSSTHVHSIAAHDHTIGHTHSIDHWHYLSINDHTHSFSGNTGGASGYTSGSYANDEGGLHWVYHNHSYSGTTGGASDRNGQTGWASSGSGAVSGNSGSPNSGTSTQDTNTGNSLPPYYSVAFIIKL